MYSIISIIVAPHVLQGRRRTSIAHFMSFHLRLEDLPFASTTSWTNLQARPDLWGRMKLS